MVVKIEFHEFHGGSTAWAVEWVMTKRHWMDTVFSRLIAAGSNHSVFSRQGAYDQRFSSKAGLSRVFTEAKKASMSTCIMICSMVSASSHINFKVRNSIGFLYQKILSRDWVSFLLCMHMLPYIQQ